MIAKAIFEWQQYDFIRFDQVFFLKSVFFYHQVALVSFLLNLLIGYKRSSRVDGVERCLLTAIDLSSTVSEPEAKFRLIVAVGTAIVDNAALKTLTKSLDISDFLASCQNATEKLKQSASQLDRVISI